MVIFAYYLLATILPVDKIIGRFYPFITVILILGTTLSFFGTLYLLMTGSVTMEPVTFDNFFN